MVTQLHQTTPEQDAHQRLRESVQRIVLDETQGGRRIVRSVVSIMEGDAPGSTPWHQLEAAKLLLKLGFEDARTTLGSIHKQGRKSAPASQEPPLPLGEGWGEGDSQQSHVNPEQGDGTSMVNGQVPHPHKASRATKLVRHIRVDTGDGTSMVKFLIDVVEGNEPDARVRDRIEAAKVLLHLCFDNPAQPDPEFMMYYAPCHPDCLCVCKDLPEDHPEVERAHTAPTDEQREQWAREAEMMEQAAEAESAALKAAQKARADKDWKLQQYHSPDTVEERRLGREELRKNRQSKREQEQERERERKREIDRENRQDLQQQRIREPEHIRSP